jgi:hypothetical protein
MPRVNISFPGFGTCTCTPPLAIGSRVDATSSCRFSSPTVSPACAIWAAKFRCSQAGARKSRAARIIGPRMVIAGPMLDGYLPNGKLRFPSSIPVTTPAEAIAAVDSLKKQGVDFIKVQSELTHDSYVAAAAEAHKQGLPFVGHVPDRVRLREVVEAGQVSVEHLMGIFEGCSTEEDKFISGKGNLKLLLSTQNKPRCDALIQLLARSQTWQVPTLAWQRGGEFLDQLDLKHQPLDKYVPAYWRNVTWKRFSDEMMPDLLRDPLALRQRLLRAQPANRRRHAPCRCAVPGGD